MDLEILMKLNSISLKENEGACVQLDNDDIRSELEDYNRSIFLCIHGGKTFNLEGFKTAMAKSW